MPAQIPYLRVFLSSPGDVNEERKIAIEVIESLPYRPALRDKVAFRVIAWDRVGGDTPMLASISPQEAINRGLPKPSECDITVSIFWSRMGTPFTDETDGQDYLSGTHWELLDALKNPDCETLIYRRNEKVLFEASDTKGQDQYRRVEAFFASDLFYKDGRILRGVNKYSAPEDFRLRFANHMEEVTLKILANLDKKKVTPEPPLPVSPNITVIEKRDWPLGKSPFPGLRAFTADDSEIFFGRGTEIDKLVRQVESSRFVAVVGASGSGKSSLVAAGLIPRLAANAISSETRGSKDWRFGRMTPGEHPFDGLYDALSGIFPQFKPNPFEARHIKQNFISDLREAPETLLDICMAGLEGAPAWAEVLLFVDQFEELFTLASPEDAHIFARMLASIAASERVRVVVTLRHDFFNKAVENQALAELLRADAVFSLAIPRRDALRQMIERPADRASLSWEQGLVEQILDDVGDEPGNLALLAFALDELYQRSTDGQLTYAAYNQLGENGGEGGVQGAIGNRAEQTFMKLSGDETANAALMGRVFHELVEVDERGTATRRRAALERFADEQYTLIDAFVKARLLVKAQDTLEVAHEALFRSWPRLVDWINTTRDDLRSLRQVEREAADWHRGGRAFLPSAERLQPVHAALARLNVSLDPLTYDFVYPQAMLLRELEDPNTDDQRRLRIGDDLALLGDPRPGMGVIDGVPDMLWLPVEAGKLTIEKREFTVYPFFIAKYLVTYPQFQAFLEADDGFNDDRWWVGMLDKYKQQAMASQRTKTANSPRDSVSWYQTVAFGRWMTHRFNGLTLPHEASGTVLRVGENAEIRLPLEWEWQWAAQGGAEARKYPWGGWQAGYANTNEAGLGRTSAVGMYPHGSAVCGALDMAGNLWEWCQNDYRDPSIMDGYINSNNKVVRGGSFISDQDNAACAVRNSPPESHHHRSGLRLVVAPLIASLSSGTLRGGT
jgi:formylglycine-generating enzyme required for sulfatase activity/energy-coupling factor transporter ATP-binding protein EcfA2